MGRKRTPENSTITRQRSTIAYARKQKGDDAKPTDDKPDDKPDATAEPEEVTQPARGRVDTVKIVDLSTIGQPPAMPATAAPAQADASTGVENPTAMPGPRDVPAGNPADPAPAPGVVPPGDSRSLRRDREFALIYRLANAVILRFGAVGTRGQWRVVEYPTVASASHAYAKECSRFVSDGFSDYRE